MNTRIANQRLLWKEVRQLWPLVASLLAVALTLHLLYLLGQSSSRYAIFIGLPGLFAVGAGALMVGQEKELRTLQWLSTLPISKKKLIGTKLLVGFSGLIIMWCLSFLLTNLFARFDQQDDYGLSASFDATVPLNSLFILLAGYALAWRARSSMVALFALIPVAIIPNLLAFELLFIASKFNWVSAPFQSVSPLPLAILIPCQLVCTIVILQWGWRNAMQALSAETTRPTRSLTTSSTKTVLGSPLRPDAALVWQAAKQNRLVLLVAVGLIVLGSILGAAAIFNSVATQDQSAFIVSGGALFVAISWLGISAFQSDRLHRRVRFLADRGISPRATWLSRHTPPICVVAIAIIAVAVLYVVAMSYQESRNLIPILILSAVVVSLLTYSISQWVGQFMTSPIVAAVVGPVIAIAGVQYVTKGFSSDTNWWIVLLAAFLPMVTTYVLMKQWMDERFDRRYWGTHAIALILFLVLPFIPIMLTRAFSRRMDMEARTALTNAYVQISYAQGVSYTARELVLTNLAPQPNIPRIDLTDDQNTQVDAPPAPKLSIDEQTRLSIEVLRGQLRIDSNPVKIYSAVFRFLQAEMFLTRLTFETASKLPESEQSQLKARYSDLVSLTTTIIQRGRLSLNLLDQEMIDRLEIHLVHELQLTKGSGLVSDDAWQNAVEVVANQSLRDESRIRALGFSWNYAQHEKLLTEFAGLPLFDTTRSDRYTKSLQAKFQVSHIAELLWKLLKANETQSVAIRTELAEVWGRPPAHYGLGKSGKHYRADDLSTFLGDNLSWITPGAQWHADWEQQAKELQQ